ncbi:MAG: glycerophosphodiester phosphodiesterase family protein [Pseudomonadota bacterium]
MQKIFSTLLLTCICAAGCSDSSDGPAPSAAVSAPPSSLTVRSTAAPEGVNGGMSSLRFPVFMDQPQAGDVTVSYETSNREATAGVDYLAGNGTATIPAGSLSTEIEIELLGDAELEIGERFELRYSVEGNASAMGDLAIGTIANDDSTCDVPFSKEPNPWIIPAGGNPLNYAHRGGVTDFPENTLYAFREVIKAGADVLEFDLFQSADGALMVIHDPSVDRTTNGTGLVADLTLAEIRALDNAYWFVQDRVTPRDAPEDAYEFRGIATGDVPPPPGYRAEDFRIPTLAEVLEAFPDHRINIDPRAGLSDDGSYEAAIAAELQRFGREDDVIVVSFVDDVAQRFKASAPCVYTAVPLQQAAALILSSASPDIAMPPVPEHVAFQIPRNTRSVGQIDLDIEVLTEDLIQDAHAANLAVQVWTINTCEEMLEVMAFGVDAIMTDEPILLESLLNTAPGERSCD